MSKTYTHAGVSKLNGEFKVRFANDGMRTKVLIKNGHTDIDIIELKNAMSKEEAVAFLLSIDFATCDGKTNDDVQNALLAEIDRRQEKPVKADKTVRAAKTVVKPTMESIKAKVKAKQATVPKSTVTKAEVKAQLADMEEAPF